MMKNLRPKEENIIKDIRKINIFRLKKETKGIKDRIVGYIKLLRSISFRA